jgi:HK97 family phage prohead protease
LSGLASRTYHQTKGRRRVLHKTLAADAAVTDQDQGTFEALVSGWSADREGDVIAPTAFDKSILAWRASGKRLPLLLEHSTTVVGAIDPETMRSEEDGLVVAGEVDRTTEEGQRVWRSIKSGVIGFSIGFLSQSRPRGRGGREIYEIDLLEISATVKPMHPATRALSWKSTPPLRIASFQC